MTDPSNPLSSWTFVWLYAFDTDFSGKPTSGQFTFIPKVNRLINWRDNERNPALARIMRGTSFKAAVGAVPGDLPYPASVPPGFMAVRVPATNDPDNSVVNFTLQVVEPDGRTTYDMVVSHDAPVLDQPDGFGPDGSQPHPLHGARAINLTSVAPNGTPSGGAVQIVAGPAGPAPSISLGDVTQGLAPAAVLTETGPGQYDLDLTLVPGGGFSTQPVPEYLLSEVDEAGRMSRYVDPAGRTWVKLHPSVSLPGAQLASGSVPATALAPEVALPAPVPVSAAAWALVDQSNRVAIAVGEDGAFDWSKLGARSTLDVTTRVRATLASGPDIVCMGDSLTAGSGGGGTSYPGTLQSLVGAARTVRNSGVGGETSIGIAARQGAQPYLLLPITGQIPASGGVQVTLSLPGGLTSWPLLQGAGTGGQMRGKLAGVPGVLTLTQPTTPGSSHNGDDFYTFTRDAAGSSVTVNRPSPFYLDFNLARRGDIFCLWYGRNNFPQFDQIIGDLNASIQFLSALDKRFIVMTVLNADVEVSGSTNYNSIATLNTRLLQTYGRRCIDIRKYLINYGLADAGITPTAQDSTDIANDVVPTSLRSDNIHLNATSYPLVAGRVHARLVELGFI